jgi:hypothetical protein
MARSTGAGSTPTSHHRLPDLVEALRELASRHQRAITTSERD